MFCTLAFVFLLFQFRVPVKMGGLDSVLVQHFSVGHEGLVPCFKLLPNKGRGIQFLSGRILFFFQLFGYLSTMQTNGNFHLKHTNAYNAGEGFSSFFIKLPRYVFCIQLNRSFWFSDLHQYYL